jgi:hydroxyacylglutathione hydrolase
MAHSSACWDSALIGSGIINAPLPQRINPSIKAPRDHHPLLKNEQKIKVNRMKITGLKLLALLLAVGPACADQHVHLPVTQDAAQEVWFTHHKIGPGIWVINDSDQDQIYLVEGDARALVIDTGLGYQNLKHYVETITSKPLLVVNTHAHPDHAGGNHAFDQVHIHKDELETLNYYTSEPVMLDTFQRFAKRAMPDHLRDKNKTAATLITIDDGFQFDLGNRILDVIHVPAHTPGSIALYDRQSANLFTGDMANTHLWMQIKYATSIADLLQSIHKLRTYPAPIQQLLPGHGEALAPDHLDVLHAATEKLLAGDCPVTPYRSPFGDEISCAHEDIFIVYKK